MADKDQLDECLFCGFPTMTREYHMDNVPHGQEQTKSLCNFCASTPCGSALEYPQNYDSGSRAVLRTLAYATNLLLVAGQQQHTHPVWREVKKREQAIQDRLEQENG